MSAASTRLAVPEPIKLEIRSCPLCANTECKIVCEYRGTTLRKCAACGVIFVFPQPGWAALTTHFENGGTAGFDDIEAKFEWNRERVLHQVAAHIQHQAKGGRLLDVGCGTGFFLTRFFRKPEWQAFGVELSHRAAEIAAARGICVSAGNVHQAVLPDRYFDVITVLDTFCYFPRPESDLAEFRRVLKQDGLLVLELPLAESRIWRTSGRLGRFLSGRRKALLETSDHLFYYSPKSVTLLLKKCGFAVEAILPLPGNRQACPLRDLAYRAYALLSLFFHFIAGSRVCLGPRFLVAARKRSRQVTL